MRAVVLSQWFPPEKAAIPEDIARGLAEHGHEVTVLTGFPNYPTGRIYEGWRQRPWLDGTTDGYRVRRVALYPSHDSSPARRAAGYFSFGATSTAFGWRSLVSEHRMSCTYTGSSKLRGNGRLGTGCPA